MATPRQSAESVMDFLGEPADTLPFSSEDVIRMTADHTVSGNPNRFQTGDVTLKLDEKWRSNIRKSHRWTVNLLTWPLLLRYGFIGR